MSKLLAFLTSNRFIVLLLLCIIAYLVYLHTELIETNNHLRNMSRGLGVRF